jgi:hypothetical protein
MAIPTNRQLWELGTPLDSAWLQFASSDAKRRYSELPTLAKFNEQAKAANIQSASEFVSVFSAGLQQWSQTDKFENELRELLLDDLFNEQLHAYARRVSPSRSPAPVRIAAELFDDPQVDWKREYIVARGCGYAEIRIIDPSRVPDFQRPRTGRKGSAKAIRKAIADLHREGLNLCVIPRKSASVVIRQKLGGNYSDGSGLSDQNLAKYILEICPKRGIDI